MSFSNSIALAQKYVALLDEVYKRESATRLMDADASLIRETSDANVIKIPKMSIEGLGTYGRNSGYVDGDVTLSWETHTFSQDRARRFLIDKADNDESAGIAFGRLADEFIRTKVTPEIDAYRFATCAGKAGANSEVASITSSNFATYFDGAIESMLDNEVPEMGLTCYMSAKAYSALKSNANYSRNISIDDSGEVIVNRKVRNLDGVRIVVVPKTRFYTAITLYDGSTAGQEAGSYIKNASTGRDIHMMFVHDTATLGIKKHEAPKIIRPEVNQSADGYYFMYRIYHDLFVPDNKTNGIYLVKSTS